MIQSYVDSNWRIPREFRSPKVPLLCPFMHDAFAPAAESRQSGPRKGGQDVRALVAANSDLDYES